MINDNHTIYKYFLLISICLLFLVLPTNVNAPSSGIIIYVNSTNQTNLTSALFNGGTYYNFQNVPSPDPTSNVSFIISGTSRTRNETFLLSQGHNSSGDISLQFYNGSSWNNLFTLSDFSNGSFRVGDACYRNNGDLIIAMPNFTSFNEPEFFNYYIWNGTTLTNFTGLNISTGINKVKLGCNYLSNNTIVMYYSITILGDPSAGTLRTSILNINNNLINDTSIGEVSSSLNFNNNHLDSGAHSFSGNFMINGTGVECFHNQSVSTTISCLLWSPQEQGWNRRLLADLVVGRDTYSGEVIPSYYNNTFMYTTTDTNFDIIGWYFNGTNLSRYFNGIQNEIGLSNIIGAYPHNIFRYINVSSDNGTFIYGESGDFLRYRLFDSANKTISPSPDYGGYNFPTHYAISQLFLYSDPHSSDMLINFIDRGNDNLLSYLFNGTTSLPTIIRNVSNIVDTLYGEYHSFSFYPKYYNDTNPSWSSNSSNDSDIKIGDNVTFSVQWTDNENISRVIFNHNQSGTFENVSNISVNTLSFNTTFSINITLPKNNGICWRQYANDSANQWAETDLFCFIVNNTIPTISSVSINNSGPSDTDNLRCNNGSVADADRDTITLYYDWLNNSISIGRNNDTLGSGNTSIGEIWQCRMWVGDGSVNSTNITSQSVSIGTGSQPPTINFTNATTTTTLIKSDSTTPTNNNSWINLSVTFNDVNPTDNHTAYFCSTNSFSNSNCTITTLCSTIPNQTGNNASCFYNTTNIANGIFTYYVFVSDNSSLISTSTSGTYEINVHPTIPTITFPLNNTFIKNNYTWLNFSSTDADSDTITYLIYTNATGSFDLRYNQTSTFFNYTNLNDTVIHWFVSARDEHNHTSENTSQFIFTIDTIFPNITITEPDNGSTFQAGALNVTVDMNVSFVDAYLSYCYFNITTSSGGSVINNREINCSSPPTNISVDVFATNMRFNLFVNDSAGNSRIITTQFTTSQSGSNQGGGGGGPATECLEDVDCSVKYNTSSYYCYNKKCVFNESVIPRPACGNGICDTEFGQEDIFKCSEDCKINKGLLVDCLDKPLGRDSTCIFKQNWFLASSFIILPFALLITFKKRKKKKKEVGL